VPIGFDKTISQPLMVAVMTNLLEIQPDDVVLEIGTGLGYQAAILAELAGKVLGSAKVKAPPPPIPPASPTTSAAAEAEAAN
jgi:protein-L-isoaspartate O-methyltransferase